MKRILLADLQKAFDTVKHDILFSKIGCCGIIIFTIIIIITIIIIVIIIVIVIIIIYIIYDLFQFGL